jgi:hypothetical protein
MLENLDIKNIEIDRSGTAYNFSFALFHCTHATISDSNYNITINNMIAKTIIRGFSLVIANEHFKMTCINYCACDYYSLIVYMFVSFYFKL